MSELHEFDLTSIKEDFKIIDSFVIDDDFIYFVNDKLGQSNNTMYRVPSIIPFEETENTEEPNGTGFALTGTSAFTFHSSDLLVETFEQWKTIAEKIPEEIYHYDEVTIFNRSDILMNLNKAIELSKKLKHKEYHLYHYGI